jgi:hypothetical protein
MTSMRSYRPSAARFITLAGLTFGLLAALARPLGAQGATIEGTWLIQVTPLNCATNAPVGPPFPSLVTYSRDGSVSESPGTVAFAPGQRSSGHGEWEHAGQGTFTQHVVALMLFPSPATSTSPAFEAGWQTLENTITLVDADNTTSVGTNQFYRANGEVYRTGCSRAVGRRFE